MGGSCAQVGKPGVKESGTPEDVPRTAAITQNCGHKKTPANLMGALLRSTLGLPSPVAELAATAEGYRAGRSCNFGCWASGDGDCQSAKWSGTTKETTQEIPKYRAFGAGGDTEATAAYLETGSRGVILVRLYKTIFRIQ